MSFTILAQVRPGVQWDVSRALLLAAQAELRTAGVLRGEPTVRAEAATDGS
jgi:hypothetical protein